MYLIDLEDEPAKRNGSKSDFCAATTQKRVVEMSRKTQGGF